ncbi:MAG TPA: hypothetical protein VHJ58_05605, partial [Vicinamibacterales bacterium]|nr:hypothetical protein [Vicinamibacterales bacterium]
MGLLTKERASRIEIAGKVRDGIQLGQNCPQAGKVDYMHELSIRRHVSQVEWGRTIIEVLIASHSSVNCQKWLRWCCTV